MTCHMPCELTRARLLHLEPEFRAPRKSPLFSIVSAIATESTNTMELPRMSKSANPILSPEATCF